MLASAGEPAQSDARTLRVVLSLMGLHDSRIRSSLPGLQVRLPAACQPAAECGSHAVQGGVYAARMRAAQVAVLCSCLPSTS